MIKRCILGACVLLLILLCVVGWGWSGQRYGYLRYYYNEGRFVYLSTGWGSAGFGIGQDNPYPADRLSCHAETFDERYLVPNGPGRSWTEFDDHWFLGFSYRYHRLPVDYPAYGLGIPYPFLALLFSLLLFFVWRTTRPRKPGQGFPVEIKAGGRA